MQFATISRPTRVHADAEAIQRRLPGQDCFPEHEEALRATVQRILGEMTTMRAGDVVGEAEDPPSIARAVARQTARLAVVDGELAEQAVVEAGVDQNVLRRDLAD